MPKGRSWLESEIQFLKDHWGWANSALAEALDRTEQSIKAIRRSREQFGDLKVYRQNLEKDLRAAVTEGLSVERISARFLANPKTIRRWLKDLGIEMDKRSTRHRKRRTIGRNPRPSYVKSRNDCKDLRYYGEDEDEFLKAVLKERDRLGRIPTLVEGMRLAVTLGWQKIAEPTELPVPPKARKKTSTKRSHFEIG